MKRRNFFQLIAHTGVTASVAQMTFGGAWASTPPVMVTTSKKHGVRVVNPHDAAKAIIVRDFQDPYLETLRLLGEVAEIEHSLMLQYLYGAFSLKPQYKALIGDGTSATPDTFLGVAVQEMQHLRSVNEFIVALGGRPTLRRQDFPYESDLYPFAFHLEPLSRHALAKYTYTEASAAAMRRTEDKAIADIQQLLGQVRVNHVGSLYDHVFNILDELYASGSADLPEPEPWLARLREIQQEGEQDHFNFFKSVFSCEHSAFDEFVWAYPQHDPRYPVLPLGTDPTAYLGHEKQIDTPVAYTLAWLGNMVYWSSLLLMDLGYRTMHQPVRMAAVVLMQTGLLPLAQTIPQYGYGLPFDVLTIGTFPGHDVRSTKAIIMHMLDEMYALGNALGEQGILPASYQPEAIRSMVQQALNSA